MFPKPLHSAGLACLQAKDVSLARRGEVSSSFVGVGLVTLVPPLRGGKFLD